MLKFVKTNIRKCILESEGKLLSELHSEPSQTFKIEIFAKIVSTFQFLTILQKAPS